jgi:hypothetical protein
VNRDVTPRRAAVTPARHHSRSTFTERTHTNQRNTKGTTTMEKLYLPVVYQPTSFSLHFNHTLIDSTELDVNITA